MDIRFKNVVLLGLGFLFVFSAFSTVSNMQKVVLDSIQKDDPSFSGDGYTSLAIIYVALAICNWLGPSALLITGPKGALILGALAFWLFVASFIYPTSWLLYTTSVLLGAGAALLWAGQGVYITKCSTLTTVTRNSGVFWALWQLSNLFGNLFVYFQFQGQTHIEADTRKLVFLVLAVLPVIGMILFATLRRARRLEENPALTVEASSLEDQPKKTMSLMLLDEFKVALRLLITRDMILLVAAFLNVGLITSFFPVYSSSVGFTLSFGAAAKQLVGMCGACIGAGEIVGGLTFGILGKKTIRFGRSPVIILGFMSHFLAFVLTALNLPGNATFGDTLETATLSPPSAFLAIFGAFLLGFGDACFNTQLYSVLASSYASQAPAAFSLYRSALSLAAGVGFAYSSHISLLTHLIILTLVGLLGTICFCVQEKKRKGSQ